MCDNGLIHLPESIMLGKWVEPEVKKRNEDRDEKNNNKNVRFDSKFR